MYDTNPNWIHDLTVTTLIRRRSVIFWLLERGFFVSFFARVKADHTGVVSHDMEKNKMAAIRIPGPIITHVPFRPKEVTSVSAHTGPRAIPKLPPTAKIDIPVAFLSPVKK
jgi:hypothetical protein